MCFHTGVTLGDSLHEYLPFFTLRYVNLKKRNATCYMQPFRKREKFVEEAAKLRDHACIHLGSAEVNAESH